MTDQISLDFARIAQDLQIRKVQVESVVQLLDAGNTVPFITRYRKERTGGLNEDVIRKVQTRVAQLRALADRKQTILKTIESQGKLTAELKEAILAAESPKRLEDLYLPYKPKKRSLATAARERGLEPMALLVWNRDPAVANLNEYAQTLVNPEKELPSPVEVLQGVGHILAEQIAETADIRAVVRAILWDTGRLTTSKSDNLPEGQGGDYKVYFQFTEPIRHIPPHRILAINRGEKEGPIKAKLEFDGELIRRVLYEGSHGRPPLLPIADHPHVEFLTTVTEDALIRLLLPSLEREIRRELTEHAQEHAVAVFARNLRSLLLQPPLRGRRVLAIDPGFRTGCKIAALDETGNLLDQGVIFPHPPQNKKDDAKGKLAEFISRHQLNVIAIGNGTACRETEELVSDLIANWAAVRTRVLTPRPKKAPAPPPTSATDPAAPSPPPAADPAAPSAEAVVAAPAGETTGSPAADAVVLAPETAAPAPPEVPATPPVEAAAPPAADPAPAAPSDPVAEPPAINAELAALIPEQAPEFAYVIVNEAGASVYSASAVGKEEFPDFDATLRGTISIGRRLQDPLSELVKIEPQNIGVGLYQHDINPKHLKESLEGVIESSVNHVGVDLNTASVPLLRHVSGLNALAARELVDYRKNNGPFKTRDQLQQVPGIGPARYEQAAGFLKILGDDPLDATWIHPESYAVARALLTDLGYAPESLRDHEKNAELREKLKALEPEEVSNRLQVGTPTLKDILEALARPGRDPREDLPPPIFKKGILKLEDLAPGMELKGTVLNVVDFGAFIDIGLKDSGLVHISQMANRYIKNPYDVVAVGDVVAVWVLKVEVEGRRVSLTMIAPGTERKPPERKPPEVRPPRQGDRPPPRQGDRPPPRVTRPPQQGQRPPARGGRPGGPPVQAPAPQEGAAGAPSSPPRKIVVIPPRPQQPPPPPRPQRQPPKPKLTQAALEGAAPLRTFSELAAFLEAKTPPKAPPTPPPEEPKVEAPPAAPAEAPKDEAPPAVVESPVPVVEVTPPEPVAEEPKESPEPAVPPQ